MKEKGINIINADMANAMLSTYQVEHFNNVIKNEVRRGFNSATIYEKGQTRLAEWVYANYDFITEEGYTIEISHNAGTINISW